MLRFFVENIFLYDDRLIDDTTNIYILVRYLDHGKGNYSIQKSNGKFLMILGAFKI